jgi:hypothetical protein
VAGFVFGGVKLSGSAIRMYLIIIIIIITTTTSSHYRFPFLWYSHLEPMVHPTSHAPSFPSTAVFVENLLNAFF